MPRHIRPPQRYAPGGKLETLKAKTSAQEPKQKRQTDPKQAPAPKQKKDSGPPPAQRSRRSRSESRASSSNSSDEDYVPSIRVRNSSETRSDGRDVQAHLREIHRLQTTTHLLIPKLPFGRLIREVLQEYMYKDYRVTAECLNALQEAAEIYMVQVFEDSYRCCLHRTRVTLGVQDMKLALYLREKWRP